MIFKNIFLNLFICFLASFFLTACSQSDNQKFINLEDKNQNQMKNKNKNLADSIKLDSVLGTTSSETSEATVENQITSDLITLTTKYGDIKIKLYTDKIPNFSQNFIKKANSGYYDGLIFHRIVPDFVAQGGDPSGDGTGGGNIASEINNTPFVRGSVGVARGGDIKINNDSQFFICLTTEMCSQLTGQYTNFGEVISGMEFVDQIKMGDKILKMKNK
jgi:peptidylprolyl isomerase